MAGKRFSGQPDFQHGREPGFGVLVVNLGTPDEPTTPALRRYLGEFLSDRRVVEIPRLLWKLILHGIILRIRPSRSAEAYQRVWTEQGSPLMSASTELTDELRKVLQREVPGKVVVELAMRYGSPSIEQGLKALQAQGAERIMVLPLYPQYSGATSGSVADAVFESLSRWRWVPELRLLGPYHDDPDYINAVADSVREHRQQSGQATGPQHKLLISFHGMPKATLEAGDPYYCHCHKTARLVAASLELQDEQWEMVFQSRFGKAEWLKPYAAKRFVELPAEGAKQLSVICPGFAVDCLETLDEIAVEGREEFLEAGGERFEYIPALNASATHVALLARRVIDNAAGWPELKGAASEEAAQVTRQEYEQARAGN